MLRLLQLRKRKEASKMNMFQDDYKRMQEQRQHEQRLFWGLLVGSATFASLVILIALINMHVLNF